MRKEMAIYEGLKIGFMLVFMVFSFNAISQYTIAVDKGGRVKRLNFYAGDYLKVKLIGSDKLGGKIEMINDTSFIINGRHILLTEVNKVYTKRPVFKYIGGTLLIGGAFFIGVDVINNAAQGNDYAFSQAIITPSLYAIGAGLVLTYFGTRRTKVKDNNFRVFNTTPIPILPENKTE